ncbi:unnamed protein product [Closterium sp. NIES-53]
MRISHWLQHLSPARRVCRLTPSTHTPGPAMPPRAPTCMPSCPSLLTWLPPPPSLPCPSASLRRPPVPRVPSPCLRASPRTEARRVSATSLPHFASHLPSRFCSPCPSHRAPLGDRCRVPFSSPPRAACCDCRPDNHPPTSSPSALSLSPSPPSLSPPSLSPPSLSAPSSNPPITRSLTTSPLVPVSTSYPLHASSFPPTRHPRSSRASPPEPFRRRTPASSPTLALANAPLATGPSPAATAAAAANISSAAATRATAITKM